MSHLIGLDTTSEDLKGLKMFFLDSLSFAVIGGYNEAVAADRGEALWSETSSTSPSSGTKEVRSSRRVSPRDVKNKHGRWCDVVGFLHTGKDLYSKTCCNLIRLKAKELEIIKQIRENTKEKEKYTSESFVQRVRGNKSWHRTAGILYRPLSNNHWQPDISKELHVTSNHQRYKPIRRWCEPSRH